MYDEENVIISSVLPRQTFLELRTNILIYLIALSVEPCTILYFGVVLFNCLKFSWKQIICHKFPTWNKVRRITIEYNWYLIHLVDHFATIFIHFANCNSLYLFTRANCFVESRSYYTKMTIHDWPGVMTWLGGGVGHALQLHQDLAEGSARHLLHLDVESLASPVPWIKVRFMLTLKEK